MVYDKKQEAGCGIGPRWYEPRTGEVRVLEHAEAAPQDAPHWIRWIDPEVGVASFECSRCGGVMLGVSRPAEACPGCHTSMVFSAEAFGYIVPHRMEVRSREEAEHE